jgi:DNA-binding NtrC family response regulator
VYSEPAKGATFKVYLPVAPYDSLYDRGDASVAPLPRGSETVLLVEDDEQLRLLTNRILAGSGFRVLTAADGEEALRVESAFPDDIQLVLTDVVMPRMSGRELVEHLVKRRPRIRVVYMSGYTDDTVVRHGVLDAGFSFLQKPLTPDALTRKVREVLDAEAS